MAYTVLLVVSMGTVNNKQQDMACAAVIYGKGSSNWLELICMYSVDLSITQLQEQKNKQIKQKLK